MLFRRAYGHNQPRVAFEVLLDGTGSQPLELE